MPLSRNKLYLLLTITFATGYVWLFINYKKSTTNNSSIEGGVCIIKHLTNVPCPSCGSTRSILSLLKGNFLDSLYWNPIGALLLGVMLIVPAWIVYDYFMQKDSLFSFYKKTEASLRQKKVAIPLILLILANWIWNIFKEL